LLAIAPTLKARDLRALEGERQIAAIQVRGPSVVVNLDALQALLRADVRAPGGGG
jgi:hypothetical protein